MKKNCLEAVAEQGEWARDHKALMTKAGVEQYRPTKLKNKGQPQSGETGIFLKPPQRGQGRAVCRRLASNAIRRQTARNPELSLNG